MTDETGIEFTRFDDIRGLHRILEVNGGGVALVDYDADGRLDVFFTQGCPLPLKTDDGTRSSELFRNGNGGEYERVTTAAGLWDSGYATGCAVADYDGDGFDDLYVAAFGPNSFWRNNGDGTFSDVTAETGTDSPLWSSSAAFADVNRDGHPDLYVVNYLDTSDDPPTLCPDPTAPDGYVGCSPTQFPAAEDVFFLSDGRGRFAEAARQSGLVGVDGKGLGVCVFHADADDWPDIYVANDGTPNFLFINRSGTEPEIRASEEPAAAGPPIPRFTEEAALRGAAVNRLGAGEASMGIACGDATQDGWPDLLLTHFHLETNTFYENLGGQGFQDRTSRTGLGPPSRPVLGFGTEFLDYDNDGALDLIIANGHIDDLEFRASSSPFRMPPQMFRNEGGGRFIDVSAWSGDYFTRRWLGRGLATGDLDNDGDLDAVVSHQLDRSSILRNDTNTSNRSVIVRLVGRGRSSRSAINARVIAEGLPATLVREVIGGGSFQSSSDRRVHIGLGEQQAVPVLRIHWPSGTAEEWRDVAAGQYVAIEGGDLVPMNAE